MIPTTLFQPLPRSTPRREGLSQVALDAFSRALERSGASMRGFLLTVNGHVVGERFWAPYQPRDRVWVYSISKSFTATAVGFAVGEGLLSIDDPLVSFFPDQLPAAPDGQLSSMRLRDLLTMTTGHTEDTALSMLGVPDGDWVRHFLSLPIAHPPGTHFCYNSGASFMLSAVVCKVTGMRLTDYLTPRLFAPLGFDRVEWDRSPLGIEAGGWGLKLRLEDLAKLGQLYLDGGRFGGRQILSADWVREATRLQSDNAGSSKDPDWVQGYGYQFWRCRSNAFRADGAAGQFCIALPDQNAVLTILSEIPNMQEIMDLVWTELLPGFAQARRVPEGRWRLEENPLGLEEARLALRGDALYLTLSGPLGVQELCAGAGYWAESASCWPLGTKCILPFFSLRDRPQTISAHYRWTAEDTLEIQWVWRETPHRDKLLCTFRDGTLTLVCPPSIVAQALGAGEVTLRGTSLPCAAPL